MIYEFYCALGSKVSVSYHFKGIFILQSFVHSLYISFGSPYCKTTYILWVGMCMMFIHRLSTLVQGRVFICKYKLPNSSRTDSFGEVLCSLLPCAHCFALSWQRISEGAVCVTLLLIVPLGDKRVTWKT